MSYLQIPTRTTADINTSADINQLQFNIDTIYVDGTIGTNALVSKSDGKTGLGVAAPARRLHVMESTTGQSPVFGDTVALLEKNGNCYLEILAGTASNGGMYVSDGAGGDNGGLIYDNPTETWQFSASNGVVTHLNTTGFGIGVIPTTTLDVEGTTSYKQITITSGTFNAQSVTATTTILCNTGSGQITMNGFTGGVIGQIIYLVHLDSANNLVINHQNGSGTQKIGTSTSANVTITGDITITLIWDGSLWRASV